MDTITAQRRIRLPQRRLDSPEACSKRWSYDDAEEYVYGELATAAVRCGDVLITMSKSTPAAGGMGGLDLDAVYRGQKAVKKYA
jgi:hypothetical protein